MKKIIAEQNAKGAKIPLDLDAYIDGSDYEEPVYIYHWDENGRLDRLDWSSCEMSGSLDLSHLSDNLNNIEQQGIVFFDQAKGLSH